MQRAEEIIRSRRRPSRTPPIRQPVETSRIRDNDDENDDEIDNDDDDDDDNGDVDDGEDRIPRWIYFNEKRSRVEVSDCNDNFQRRRSFHEITAAFSGTVFRCVQGRNCAA